MSAEDTGGAGSWVEQMGRDESCVVVRLRDVSFLDGAARLSLWSNRPSLCYLSAAAAAAAAVACCRYFGRMRQAHHAPAGAAWPLVAALFVVVGVGPSLAAKPGE
ncbi:N-acyl-aromatic-L-amino acid amidohydrolase (carboxylate-forming) [Frankliniella fusca]|uniref:N-acyl-aromatic-L-amino acid amidohydrolase (Carboxylate-forming) n=1 Tax=Frankliniella fusca TaxID=407009 RepID=A0AAE1HMI9_9NEOP|nr:N-acyl-aromatic-L-amino acid amidohydrolase (carboxylate-forming) [Frankliniella fusca]